MKKYLQKKLKNEKGMTLIELLAVIVIIAIIAAIAIPAIGNIIENSRVGTMKSDNLNAIAAAELYLMDNPSPTSGNVTLDNIIGTTDVPASYLDNKGSLLTFSYNKDTKKVISTAVQGSMKLDITTGVTKSEINSFKNSDRTTTGNIKAAKVTN